jgi:hypothetical protein
MAGTPYAAQKSQLADMQAQVNKANAQNTNYANQIAALQKQLSGEGIYQPTYTQQASAPVSYAPNLNVVQQWQPNRVGLPQAPQGVVQQWTPNSFGGVDALSRIANTHFAKGGITDLLGQR